MEGINRLVAESLARYGFDRPLDYRRLHWSRWFRCDSLHSLLHVPSKPGVFALAEEVMELGTDRVGTAAPGCPAEPSSAAFPSRANAVSPGDARRMLAVLQFCEDDDMAFVLDRMLSRQNPMSARLASGRCFVRYVIIEDEAQRRSICNALNQWAVSSGEKTSGIGAHFASSIEVSVARAPTPAAAGGTSLPPQARTQESKTLAVQTTLPAPAPHLDSGSAANIHCPHPIPSGF